MRVWLVERADEGEVPARVGTFADSTHAGVFATPADAADVWTEQARRLAGRYGKTVFTLGSDVNSDPVLTADRGGDIVTMTGVQVHGTSRGALTVADWGTLKALLASAMRIVATPRTDEPQSLQEWLDSADTSGTWTISRTDETRK